MYNHTDQVVQTMVVTGVLRRVEKPQLKREYDPIRQLGVLVKRVAILEAFQVQNQDGRELL